MTSETNMLACWPDIRTLSGHLLFTPMFFMVCQSIPSEQCYQRLLHKPCLVQPSGQKQTTRQQLLLNCFGQNYFVHPLCHSWRRERFSWGSVPNEVPQRKDPTAGDTAVIAGLWTRQRGGNLICACMHDVSYFEHDKLQQKNMETGNTLPSETIHAISIFIHVYTQSLSLSLSLSLYNYIYI